MSGYNMLEKLKCLEESGKLYKMIIGAIPKVWHTVDINYRPPHVERIWCRVGDDQINLHCIHPCNEGVAFFHPHPWASAIHAIDGYEMGIGRINERTPEPLAIIELAAGSYYSMENPNGMHYVRPVNRPNHSVMISSPPWKWHQEKPQGKIPLPHLNENRIVELMSYFENYYRDF